MATAIKTFLTFYGCQSRPAHDLYGGRLSGKQFKLAGPLMDEHLQTVNAPAAACRGLPEQAGLKRFVDDVHYH